MSTTQFKAFGTGPGNSVTDIGTYIASPWLQTGFPPGLLTHDDLNRVLRQATVPVAALTQMVADYLGVDVLDDGDVGGLTTKFKQAMSVVGLAYVPGGTYPPGSLGDFLNHVNAGGTLTSDQIVALLTGVLGESQLTPTLQARLNLIDTPSTGLVAKVADLQTTYGSTAAAAVSASNAASSAASALDSKNQAAISAGAALTSETNANASKVAAATSAGSASTSASDAASSASSAAGSASQASTSASQAATSATGAQNSATAAATSASSASTSATTAGTYAATAQTQAQNAATSAGSAQTSATQAATSASTAQTSASTATSQASLAATSAAQAANSAAAAAATGAAVGGLNLAVRQRYVTLVPVDISWGVGGWGWRVTGTGASVQILQLDVSPLAANTPYSVSFKAKVVSGGSSATLAVSFQPATLPNTSITVGTDGTVTYTWQNVSSASSAWASAQLRMDATLPLGMVVEVTDVKVEQGATATAYTPSPIDGRNYANAAQTAANTATSEANAAGSSASSASTSATQASTYASQAATSAGSASTSASQASQSATSASGSASSAATSASTASQSATSASQSATAATNAASTAQTSASSAQTSAIAAGQSATAAATQSSNAGTFAGQAAQSATAAANSASAAATSYNNTVSATGSLTAQVSSVQQAQTSMDGRLQTAEANYTLKVVTTRSDGKKVLGGIGIASVDNGTVQQSEILLQADRLVFVPSSNPNAAPVGLLQVGTVNGVTTLVVPQALIGDAVILGRMLAGSITADKLALTTGSVSAASASNVPLSAVGAAGSGGFYASMSSNVASGYVTSGGLATVAGIALGTINVPYPGQTIHASITGNIGVKFGANWSGAPEGLQGLSVIARLSLYRITSGNQVDNTTAVIRDWWDTDITYLFANSIRRRPFVVTLGRSDVPVGSYVLILAVNIDAYQYPAGIASQTGLFALDPANTFMSYQSHMFANAV